MKTIKNIFVIVAFGLLIIWTSCVPKEDEATFTIRGTWKFEKVTPPEGFIESGDWTSFEIAFDGGGVYTIKNVSPGYEVLWTTDPTLFSSSEGGTFSSGTYVYPAATATTFTATAVLKESSGGSFTIGVEKDIDLDLDKMTLFVSPNVGISGRVSGIEDPWEFEMNKK